MKKQLYVSFLLFYFREKTMFFEKVPGQRNKLTYISYSLADLRKMW